MLTEVLLYKPGIYCIVCEKSNKTYIGSSNNLRKRCTGHLWKLRSNKHENPKLQAAWNKYGEDYFSVEPLIYTEIKESLIPLEQTYFNLYNPELNICPIAGSYRGVVRAKKVVDKQSKTYTLVSPGGVVTTIKNLEKFGRDNNLDPSHLGAVFTGKVKSHKNWTANLEDYQDLVKYGSFISKGRSPKEPYQVVSPEGLIHKFFNITHFAKENELSRRSLGQLCEKKKRSCLGWTRNLKDHLFLKKYGSFTNKGITYILKNTLSSEEIEVPNIDRFSKEVKLPYSGIYNLCKGKIPYYKNYVLVKELPT
jgi:group I intron endonuclease